MKHKTGYDIVTAPSEPLLKREVWSFIKQKREMGEHWQAEGPFTVISNGVGQAMVRATEIDTSCTLGVGTGAGKLFVHGDYESIKAAQALIFRMEAAERRVRELEKKFEKKRDPRDPDYTKQGIFIDHRCWKCNDGEKLCPHGHSLNCEYPHARND